MAQCCWTLQLESVSIAQDAWRPDADLLQSCKRDLVPCTIALRHMQGGVLRSTQVTVALQARATTQKRYDAGGVFVLLAC